MLKLQKKGAAKKANHLKPGVVTSTATAVEQDPNYAEGHAKRIIYDMIDSSGNHFPYHETFMTVEPLSVRSEDFFAYLENNGITEWEDFVGCQEVLTLQYEFKGGVRFLNIDQKTRQFVYEDEEGESDVDAE